MNNEFFAFPVKINELRTRVRDQILANRVLNTHCIQTKSTLKKGTFGPTFFREFPISSNRSP
jgi:hypothetical protein